MWENKDQKNSEFRHFLRIAYSYELSVDCRRKVNDTKYVLGQLKLFINVSNFLSLNSNLDQIFVILNFV